MDESCIPGIARAASALVLSTLMFLSAGCTAAAEAQPIAAEAQREAAEARRAALETFRGGIRLKATKCPDGEGHYYVIGIRPSVKGFNDTCIDVTYRATCSTNQGPTLGTMHNFVGGGSCFGDTGQISPKPSCEVKDVTVVVDNVTFCK
jgi:hypothetical protein